MREALAARLRRRSKWGDARGLEKSRLDPFEAEIIALLRNGSPRSFVAKRYKVSEPALYNFIEKRNRMLQRPVLERTA
jgi:hypothetical protein